MDRMRLTFILALCLLAAGPHDARSAPAQNCHAVSREACTIAHGLGRGINLGNMLDAPREGDWGVRLEPRFIELAMPRRPPMPASTRPSPAGWTAWSTRCWHAACA
jgi:hypothetical protein